jgi:hypothetical protein
MRDFQKWLLTPAGIMAVRVFSTILKAVLVFLSAKVPALGLGENVDALVADLAPAAAIAFGVWWSAKQSRREARRVKKALYTRPPSCGGLCKAVDSISGGDL